MSPDNTTPLAVVRQFQSEVDALREAPYPRWTRVAILSTLVMFGTVTALLFVIPMDRVVTSLGAQIVPTEQVNVYQALDPSIIRSLDVKVGQPVRAGELMATLDPTFTSADVTQLRQQVASYEAQIARDEAQIADRPLVFPDRTDAAFLKYAALQHALYDQQVSQYRAQVKSYDSKISETEASIKKFRVDADGFKGRLGIASRIENMRTVLAGSGSGTQLAMWQQQDARAEMERQVAYDLNSLAESEQTLASQKSDREAYIQQYLAGLSQDLVTARGGLDTATSQLEKAARRQDLVHITAVEDTVVLSVANVSVGSVLKQGDQIFTSMPAKTAIEAEAQVETMYVGFVQRGDRCVLKIDAFDFVEHGTAEGKVTWISDDTFTSSASGQPAAPYYKVRCSVDAMHFKGVPPNMRLIPGMTLETDIIVGTRSVAMYLLGGILRGYSEAMREP